MVFYYYFADFEMSLVHLYIIKVLEDSPTLRIYAKII